MHWTFPHPSGAIEVESARDRDAGPVLRLHRQVLAEREYFITLPAEHASTVDQKVRMIRDFRRRSTSVFLVAHQADELVGFLTVQGGVLRRMRHAGKLEIMVAHQARGTGVGRALMTACLEWAEANPDLTKLGLSVFSTNERAVALYRHFKFEVEGHRRREYRMEDGSWRDDLLMYRFVDSADGPT